MQNDRRLGRISGKALAVAAALALLAILALPATPAEAQSISVPAQSGAGAVSREAETMTGATSPQLRTSAQGLVATDSMVVGGGVLVDLQGGFQNVVTATVGADGTMTSRCETELSAGGGR